MRITLIVFLFFAFCTKVAGQASTDTASGDVPIIYGDRLKVFLDSLKTKVLADTAKFSVADLIFTANGRRNTKAYSQLFIVNGSYIYKLDIIKGLEVAEFVNEILDDKKVKSITYIDSSKASEHFGENAWQGIMLITMFDKARFKPTVAGLVLRKNKSGDNFTARKKGELLIHD